MPPKDQDFWDNLPRDAPTTRPTAPPKDQDFLCPDYIAALVPCSVRVNVQLATLESQDTSPQTTYQVLEDIIETQYGGLPGATAAETVGAKLQAVEDFDEAAFSAYLTSEDYNEDTAATWNSRTLANRAALSGYNFDAPANPPPANPQAGTPGGGGPGGGKPSGNEQPPGDDGQQAPAGDDFLNLFGGNLANETITAGALRGYIDERFTELVDAGMLPNTQEAKKAFNDAVYYQAASANNFTIGVDEAGNPTVTGVDNRPYAIRDIIDRLVAVNDPSGEALGAPVADGFSSPLIQDINVQLYGTVEDGSVAEAQATLNAMPDTFSRYWEKNQVAELRVLNNSLLNPGEDAYEMGQYSESLRIMEGIGPQAYGQFYAPHHGTPTPRSN